MEHFTIPTFSNLFVQLSCLAFSLGGGTVLQQFKCVHTALFLRGYVRRTGKISSYINLKKKKITSNATVGKLVLFTTVYFKLALRSRRPTVLFRLSVRKEFCRLFCVTIFETYVAITCLVNDKSNVLPRACKLVFLCSSRLTLRHQAFIISTGSSCETPRPVCNSWTVVAQALPS